MLPFSVIHATKKTFMQQPGMEDGFAFDTKIFNETSVAITPKGLHPTEKVVLRG
jgi:hypothetical protein